jgi:hypothetical protein
MSGFLSRFRKLLPGAGDRPERESTPSTVYGARDHGPLSTGLSSPVHPDTNAATTEPEAPPEAVQMEEAAWEEAPLEETPGAEAPLEEAPLADALPVGHETVTDALPAAEHEPAKTEEEIAFDEEWYLLRYDDVARVVRNNPGQTGLRHYLIHGEREGREPLPPPDWDREAAREAAARKIGDL